MTGSRSRISLRATDEREKKLARVKDAAEVDGDAEAIDLALDAYLQLNEIADVYEDRLAELEDEFNTRGGAMSLTTGKVRRS